MKRIVAFLCTGMLFYSCQKNKCNAPLQAIIESNGPIVEGWDLNLKTLQNPSYIYKWSGPNGWDISYEYYSSEAYQQTRPALTMKDAGAYKVQMINNEGCIAYEGTTNIEVIAPPQAPCTIPRNSSTSSVGGIGNYDFTYRSFIGSGNFYLVSASQGTTAGSTSMRFAFPGATQPLPGIYTIALTTFGLDNGTVGLHIDATTYQFYASPGQKVYVTKENGKLSISFCTLSFNNPINPSIPITISANVTQP